MELLLKIVHVLVSVFMILVILLQAGKDPGMGGLAGGGGGSSTAFGGRGSQTLLEKVTIGCAVLFMATAIVLAMMSSRSTSMVLQRAADKAAAAAKATSGSTAAPAPLAPAKDQGKAPAAPAKPAPAPAKPAPAAPAK